jgi:hypothetical protein
MYQYVDGYINKRTITRHNITYRPINDHKHVGENNKAPMLIVDDKTNLAKQDKRNGLFINAQISSEPYLRKSTLCNQNTILFEGGPSGVRQKVFVPKEYLIFLPESQSV